MPCCSNKASSVVWGVISGMMLTGKVKATTGTKVMKIVKKETRWTSMWHEGANAQHVGGALVAHAPPMMA